MSTRTRLHWWTFRDCGQCIAFFSEKSMAEWYAEAYATVAQRTVIPSVEAVYRIDFVLQEEMEDEDLYSPDGEPLTQKLKRRKRP